MDHEDILAAVRWAAGITFILSAIVWFVVIWSAL